MNYEKNYYRIKLRKERFTIGRTLNSIKHFLNTNTDEREAILELGCGEYPHFENSTKADIAPIKGYLQVDCNKPFKIRKKFDKVIAIELIEHLWNVDGFLEELKKIIKPNGEIIISTPNVKYWRVRLDLLLGKDRNFDNNGTHLWYFSPQSFRKKMEEHGLEIIEMKPLGATKILDIAGGFITRIRIKR